MDSSENIGSFFGEQKDMNQTESAENLLGKHNSLDCSASRSVQAIDISQHHIATTRGLSNCDNQIPSNDVEMVTDESNEKPFKPKELKLMDVNDDCLSAIFKRLPTLDLAAVADVCQRFRSIAQENFWLDKTLVEIPQDVSSRKYKYGKIIAADEKRKIIQRTFRLFRNFGSLMTKLKFMRIPSVDDFDEIIIALIIKYCNKNLTVLDLLIQLRSFPFEIKPILRNLKKLDVESIHKDDFSVYEWLAFVEDFSLCSDCRTLCHTFYVLPFERLKRISLRQLFINGPDFSMLLNNNETVKDIDLYDIHLDDFGFEFPVHIETLYLHLVNESLENIDKSSFGKLKNLNSLDICLDSPELSDINSESTEILREIVDGDIPLKNLALYGIALNMSMESRRLCDYFSKLVHLETFTLTCPEYRNLDEIRQLSPKLHRLSDLRLSGEEGKTITVDEIVTIVSSFHNLQHLIIGTHRSDAADTVEFETKSFEKLVAIVQSRINNTRLDVELDRGYKLEIPIDLVQRHRHILRVKKILT